jgi:hypothetical protein
MHMMWLIVLIGADLDYIKVSCFFVIQQTQCLPYNDE